MSTVALLLSIPVLLVALALPAAASVRPPAMDHHGLVWRSGPVRRERLQWWVVLAVGAALAGTVLALLVSHAAAVEATHGVGPHAHFALTRDGILTAKPTGWQPWALLPPPVWLLPIPLLAVAALAVPIAALRARWQLTGRRDRLSVRRAWPWRTHHVRWSDVTEVYAAGATLHIETRQGGVALHADGGELDVAAAAAWLAAARDQARDEGPPLAQGTAPPLELQALRARARPRAASGGG
jgi:hypothetical protein